MAQTSFTRAEYEAYLIEMRESRDCKAPAARSDEVKADERAKPRTRRASRPMREARRG